VTSVIRKDTLLGKNKDEPPGWSFSLQKAEAFTNFLLYALSRRRTLKEIRRKRKIDIFFL
jgi:hypothetical protein